MKIAPLSTEHAWLPRVLSRSNTWVERLADVPIDAVVRMEQVKVLNHGQSSNFRPFLHLSSVLEAVEAPTVELPYGIERLEYEKGTGPRIDAFYEFDNDQLTTLVRKGYFSGNFEVPHDMVGIQWALPAKAALIIVGPDKPDAPPLVFLDVDERSQLRFDTATSGYELAQYFPDYAPEEDLSPLEEERRRTERDEGMRTHRGRVDDLFAGIPFAEFRGGFTRHLELDGELFPAEGRGTVPDRVFDKLVATAKQDTERRNEEFRAGLGEDLSTVEGVYRARVASAPRHEDTATQSILDAASPFSAASADQVLRDAETRAELRDRTRRQSLEVERLSRIAESGATQDLFAEEVGESSSELELD